MSHKWVSREYQPGDEAQILKLFKRTFGLNRSNKHWEWEFLQNCLGKSTILVAVDPDREELVGQVAYVPIPMNCRGQKVIGSQTVDLMIDSRFWNQGIFLTLAAKCCEKAEAMGIQLVYGFANKRLSQGWTRGVKFRDLGGVPQYHFVLNFCNYLRTLPKYRGIRMLVFPVLYLLSYLFIRLPNLPKRRDSTYKIVAISEPDEVFNKLWEQCRTKISFSTWRDAEYLRWRYFTFPDYKYRVFAAYSNQEMVGWMVLLKHRGYVGVIVDFLYTNHRVMDEMLAHALRYFRRWGRDYVSCPFEGDPEVHQSFVRFGFRQASPELRFVLRPLGNASFDPLGVNNLGLWYLTYGDTDHL
ncbi:GNAT family N-acetyltransferase [Acidobacteria bacterium AH-259-D05]|nr:GNAT family N-acetyltransferase [Acidobacteria bacterium AH-259-D05]